MRDDVLILGGGPAGLTAAYQLAKARLAVTVLERDAVIGGLARTITHQGFRFDIGGHRFFTKLPEVQALWQELLGAELLTRPRLSRIYYNRRFFHYPLKPLDAALGLGVVTTAQVLASYLHARLFPCREETNFEQWVCNRFGRRLYELFFKTYTQKVWGIPCAEISAEWAAQRIQNLSLGKAIARALVPGCGRGTIKTLIERFEYPRLGPGQMWERCRDLVEERGQRVLTRREVVTIRHAGGRVVSVTARDDEGRLETLPASEVISSMALPDVIRALEPAPPPAVLEAGLRLRFRDFLTVCLIVDRSALFPDNWIYVHSPEVRVGRVQNFNNWSPDMAPDPGRSGLGLEYFVSEGDDLWAMPDDGLLELAAREIEELGLLSRRQVSDGCVVRVPRAYPVYDAHHGAAVATIRRYLETLPNLQQVGRNGQHRYNNQDHSMLTAMLAVRNVLGERHEVWEVNADAEYHETLERAQPRRLATGRSRRAESEGSPASASRPG